MIKGTQNPVVGKEVYRFSDGLDVFNTSNAKYFWNIWKKKQGKWVNITEKPTKKGFKVTFNFGEKVIGEEFKLQVFKATPKFLSKDYETNSVGEIIVVPTSGKVPKITKVVLFNRGAKDPNKASYADTLVAQAHCVEMFQKEIQFQLWEDDAQGGGHNAVVNKNNQFPQSFKARVNKNGIAEAKIPLSSNSVVLRNIANKFMMAGDSSEGANHEYYVTASYEGKIQGASQVNVDVKNPDNKKELPKVAKPASDSYKKTLPKAGAKPSKNNQNGKDGSIVSVEFRDLKGNTITKTPKYGESINVYVITKNVIGKRYWLKLWESDYIGKNDLLYSKIHKIERDNQMIKIPLTKAMQQTGELGNDKNNPDYGEYTGERTDHQELFIEIAFADISMQSKTLNIDANIDFAVPEQTISPAVVKDKMVQHKDNKGNCIPCQIGLTVQDLDKFMSATEHGSILNVAPYNTRIPSYILYLNQYMTEFDINKNCYRRANFLGQVAKETKFWSYKEDFIYDKTALLDLKNFQSAEGRVRAKEWGYGKNKSEITKEIEIKIGNWAYGRSPKRSSLGNNECPLDKLNDPEQDGYKYRGRGLIQLTGKYNYTKFQEWYDINYTKLGLSAANFVKYPDLVFEPQYIVLSAIYFWNVNNLNGKADAGIEEKHVLSISNVINGNESDKKKEIRYDYVKAAYSKLQEKATNCLLVGKKETKTTSEWHDPVDQPQITVHDFSGTYRPDFSSFGGHRGRPHTGLDIFAINKKTKIYACLKGGIVYSDNIPGYGKTIVLKVDKKTLEKYKKKYKLQYDKEGNLYDSGDDRYILYGHLESYDFKAKEVDAGDIIGTSGVTGVAEGTHGPHLHIEFTNKKLPQKGDGYKYRCNPLFYISLHSENLKIQQKHNKTNRSTDKI